MPILLKNLAVVAIVLLLQSCNRETTQKVTRIDFALEDQEGKKWSHVRAVDPKEPFNWSGFGQGPVIEQGSLYHDVKEIKRSSKSATLHVKVWRNAKDDGSFGGFSYEEDHLIEFDVPFAETIAPGIILKGRIDTSKSK